MVKFSNGKAVELTDGRLVTVTSDSFLAEGGQGTLYNAECSGSVVILKWYHSKSALKKPDYLKPLLVELSALNISNLILPKGITVDLNRQYGYIMDRVPDNMHTLDKVVNDSHGKFIFKGKQARFKAAQAIANTISQVHKAGFSFNDLNGSNIFVSRDGDVRFCDVDSMCRVGDTPLVTGVREYQAPEVVLGSLPDVDTDNYSLAVILFNLLVGKDPFLGSATLGRLNDGKFEHIYAYPVFIFHPDDDSNRIDDKPAIDKWDSLPDNIKALFVRTFVQGAKDKTERATPDEWLSVLSNVSFGNAVVDTATVKDKKHLEVYFIVDCSRSMEHYGKKDRVVKEINEYVSALRDLPDLKVELNILQFADRAVWLYNDSKDINSIMGDIELRYSGKNSGIGHAYDSLWQHLNKDELKEKSRRLHPPLLILISDGKPFGYSDQLRRLKSKPLFKESLKFAIGIDGDDRIYDSDYVGYTSHDDSRASLTALIDFAGRSNTKTTGEAKKSVGQILKEVTLAVTKTFTNSGKKAAQKQFNND